MERTRRVGVWSVEGEADSTTRRLVRNIGQRFPRIPFQPAPTRAYWLHITSAIAPAAVHRPAHRPAHSQEEPR